MENNQPHLFAELKDADADRAFLSLFSPVKERLAIQVIDLWNAEIARIRDEVREPHMGIIRLQWWRDEIKRICGGGRSVAHPVLVLLSDIIPTCGLPFELFDGALQGREFEFEDRAAVSVEELAAYAQSIHQPVLELKSKIFGYGGEVGDLARDYALIGIIRSVPFQAQQGRKFIPTSKDAVREICGLVSLQKVPHKYFKATSALAQLYLKQIETAGYDPFAIRPVPFKEFRVWFKSL